MKRNILILGGDGYLGWPTAMHFANHGHDVRIIDGLHKRLWEDRMGVRPLFSLPTLQERVEVWNAGHPQKRIDLNIADIAENHLAVYNLFEEFRPDTVIHYAEQPSAPFSMKDRNGAVTTSNNNIAGTLNVLFAMREFVPDAHLVKLGTMGEYGTPEIDIEEGWLEITHKGRTAKLPYPKLPGSFYHASKVADSTNIEFACRSWGIRATDLNQGVVYGIDTSETKLDPMLMTSFHYDAVFGTALNRFIVQAVNGVPLTVYGKGGQKRGFLNIIDTLQCVDLATNHPALPGQFRVFNQFTETFSVLDLATRVKRVADEMGFPTEIAHVPNPRVEKEDHYYNAANTELKSLGLESHLLTEDVIASMLSRAKTAKGVNVGTIPPKISWRK